MVTIKLNDTNDRMLTTTVITTNDRVLRGKCGAISEKKEMSMEYYSPGGVCVGGGGGRGSGRREGVGGGAAEGVVNDMPLFTTRNQSSGK